MVGTLMALKDQIPAKSKDTARELVKEVVNEIMKRMEQDLRRAVTGALNKKAHTPIANFSSTDWKRTIQRNLKNYDTATKRLIPEKFYFFERTQKQKNWTVILDIDQSGSMCDSIIYSSVMGSIFASMPALDTHVVVFDTEITDLTEACRQDPVDMLLAFSSEAEPTLTNQWHIAKRSSRTPAKRCSSSYPTSMREAYAPDYYVV